MVRRFPHGRTTRVRLTVITALTASLIGAFFVALPQSSAQDDDRELQQSKNRLDNRISNRREDLHEISAKLVKAAARVQDAYRDLDQAKAALIAVREQVKEAAIYDDLMQARLDAAEVRLADARADLAQGRVDVTDQHEAVTSYAVSTFQSGDLASSTLDIAFQTSTPEEVFAQLQANDTVLDKQAVSLQELEAAEVLLQLTEERVETTKEEVEVRRTDAAESLDAKQALKVQAQVAKDNVATRLDHVREAKQEIAEAKRNELQRLQKLQKERDRVEARLRKIAERRARLENRRLQTRAKIYDGGGALGYPVRNTYITSPYGMRFHPILHIYKLHDGTDFGADCGRPVYAAADGRVIAEYYNSGYGNRIIVDHGFVRGTSLATSYNHLNTFVARPGQNVKRGEIIGYAGTTGYSTGCHLHFMVYANGYTVNPMNWL